MTTTPLYDWSTNPLNLEVLPDLCPHCGAGVVSRADGIAMIRLGRNWLTEECVECDRRSRVRMYNCGRTLAFIQEKAFFDHFNSLNSEPSTSG